MKFIEPKIKIVEDVSFFDMVKSGVYYDSRVSVLSDKKILIENVTIEGCIFEKQDFNLVEFKNVDFWDTVFEDCSFSNMDFADRSFSRCLFKNCKLVGTTFENCSFDNVKFLDCSLRYASFFRVRFKNIIFDNVNLDDARFYEIKDCKDLMFLNSSMNFTEIVKCTFTNIDFSSNEIHGFKTDFGSIKSNTFNVEQALMLTKLLEINIKVDN